MVPCIVCGKGQWGEAAGLVCRACERHEQAKRVSPPPGGRSLRYEVTERVRLPGTREGARTRFERDPPL